MAVNNNMFFTEDDYFLFFNFIEVDVFYSKLDKIKYRFNISFHDHKLSRKELDKIVCYSDTDLLKKNIYQEKKTILLQFFTQLFENFNLIYMQKETFQFDENEYIYFFSLKKIDCKNYIDLIDQAIDEKIEALFFIPEHSCFLSTGYDLENFFYLKNMDSFADLKKITDLFGLNLLEI